MINLYNKIIDRIKFLSQYTFVSARNHFKVLPLKSKRIFIRLDSDLLYRDDDGMGRYAYMLLNAFNSGGYSVYFNKKVNFLTYLKLGKYGRMIYLIKNLKFVNHPPSDTHNYYYAFDSINSEHLLGETWKKKIYVNILRPTFCRFGNVIWIPYFLHPQMYRLNQVDRIHSLRSTPRSLRIFFGGNTTSQYYNNPDVSNNYNQLTRIQAVNTVKELGSIVKTNIDTRNLLQRLKTQAYTNECWLLETDKKRNTASDEWLDIISHTDFFLCFSGTDLPMCHNLIESMSLGTIPIMSYADWMFPALEHKKNAIIYTDKDDLKRKIQEVLNMGKDEIESMRNNVTAYFDQYLTNSTFISNIEADQGNICTIMLQPKLATKEKDNTHGKEILNFVNTKLGINETDQNHPLESQQNPYLSCQIV